MADHVGAGLHLDVDLLLHERGERRLELGADRPIAAHRGRDIDLDLGLVRQSGEFDQELVVDTDLLGFLQVGRELGDLRPGGVVRLRHQLLDPEVQLLFDLGLLAGGPVEKRDPRLIEGGRGRWRGFAGGRQFLALEIGILRRTKPQVTGVRLRCQHLASRRLEVLLRERFAHLLPEDESGDQDEGPKHHHDPGGVATKESKSTGQHRCHRILRASCTWGNGQTAQKFR